MKTKYQQIEEANISEDFIFQESQSEVVMRKEAQEDPSIEFLFPPNDFADMKFMDPEFFKKYLRLIDPDKSKLFKFNRNKQYMYASCRHCEVKISLKKLEDGNGYTVQKFRNGHIHKLSRVKNDQQREISSFMNSKSYTFESKGIESILKDRFGINHRRYIYLKSKKVNLDINLQDYIDNLKVTHSVDVGDWYTDAPAPEYLLVVSESMRETYKHFGDSIRFDITYNLLRYRTMTQATNKPEWNVGVISGFNQNLSNLIFGIVIIRKETQQNFSKIFNNFFSMMNGQKPESIITDQQAALQSCFEKMRRSEQNDFVHLLDQFHIIRLIASNFKDEVTRSSDIQLLKTVVYERNKNSVSKAMDVLLKKYPTGTNSWVRWYFNNKLNKFSIFHAPRHFFGLSITSSPLEKLNDIIKTKLPVETTIPKVIAKIEKFGEELSKKPIKVDKSSLLKCFMDSRLYRIQRRLGSKVFMRFMKYYIAGMDMQIESEDRTEQPTVYTLRKRNGEPINHGVSRHYCSCGIFKQQGLPCPHMLTIYRHHRELDIEYVIKKRWLIQEEEKEVPKERSYVGRPRISRRNMQK